MIDLGHAKIDVSNHFLRFKHMYTAFQISKGVQIARWNLVIRSEKNSASKGIGDINTDIDEGEVVVRT